MAQHFNPPDVWQPFGAFSMGVAHGAGRIVRLKGQVALDPAGNIVGAGDMPAQLGQVLENIRQTLAHVGGRMEDIVSLVQHTTDIEAFMACGEVRQTYFAPPYPVTTTVEVKRLFDPSLLIEITATAEIPEARFVAPSKGVDER